MDPAEFLSLGTPHPIDTQNVGKGTAPCRWEFADAGWALAGLPTHQELLLRVKYMGESLMVDLAADAVGHAVSEVMKWRDVDADLSIAEIRRTAIAALTEFISPDVCQTCNGRRALKVGDAIIECKTCEGWGTQSYSQRKRAKLMGIDRRRSKHSNGLHRLYDVLGAMFAGWESEALSCVRRKIKNHQGGT